MSTVYLHSDREGRASWADKLQNDPGFADSFLRLVLIAHLTYENQMVISDAQMQKVEDCDIHITEHSNGSITVELGPSQ